MFFNKCSNLCMVLYFFFYIIIIKYFIFVILGFDMVFLVLFFEYINREDKLCKNIVFISLFVVIGYCIYM